MVSVFQLEKKMVPVEQWAAIAHNYPQWLRKQMDLKDAPIGFGYDEEVGWFSLESSGQGPYMVWSEKVQDDAVE